MNNDAKQIAKIRLHIIARLAEIAADLELYYIVDYERVPQLIYTQQLRDIVDWCDEKLAEDTL